MSIPCGIYILILGLTEHKAHCDKSKVISKVVETFLSIGSFGDKCAISEGVFQCEQPQQNIVSIREDYLFTIRTLYKNKFWITSRNYTTVQAFLTKNIFKAIV